MEVQRASKRPATLNERERNVRGDGQRERVSRKKEWGVRIASQPRETVDRARG